MKKILLSTIAALSLVTLPQAAAAQQSTTQTAKSVSIPVTGSGGGSTFTGVFQLQRFVASGGVVTAAGTLTGTLTDAGGTVTSIVRNIALPVTVGQTTCEILHLELGPLSLDLLGLQINLNQVVLDITAQPGAGNLLGNLLCAVAGLLDNPSGLARILNDILAILG